MKHCTHNPEKLGYNPSTKQVSCGMCKKSLVVQHTVYCIVCYSRQPFAGTQEVGEDMYYTCGRCYTLVPIRLAEKEVKNMWE